MISILKRVAHWKGNVLFGECDIDENGYLNGGVMTERYALTWLGIQRTKRVSTGELVYGVHLRTMETDFLQIDDVKRTRDSRRTRRLPEDRLFCHAHTTPVDGLSSEVEQRYPVHRRLYSSPPTLSCGYEVISIKYNSRAPAHTIQWRLISTPCPPRGHQRITDSHLRPDLPQSHLPQRPPSTRGSNSRTLGAHR